jgi:hypothetical protein
MTDRPAAELPPKTPPITPSDSARRRRLELFRAHDLITKAIGGIETTDQMKGELRILFAAAFRLTLAMNDGGVSPRELPLW